MNVSIRDLKNGLSAYLRLVRRGERIVVTDRGQPIAELAPADDEALSLDQRLQRLVAAGELRAPRGRKRLRAIVAGRVRGGPVSVTVLEDRG